MVKFIDTISENRYNHIYKNGTEDFAVSYNFGLFTTDMTYMRQNKSKYFGFSLPFYFI
jgi:hypothetical protein